MHTLETERLVLRPWEPEDAGFAFDLYSRWEVQRFIGKPPRVMAERSEAEERISAWRHVDHPVHAVWAVQLKESGRLAGKPAPEVHPGLRGVPAATAIRHLGQTTRYYNSLCELFEATAPQP